MADDSMMRVAVAGTNSLALLIAHFIVKETSHQVLVLSRFVSQHSKAELPLLNCREHFEISINLS
jgi:hypothetical protein